MSRKHIRRVAVLGAGVMGAQIAALCVNAGVPVVLFDLAGSQVNSGSPAQEAIRRLAKLKPAPLATAALANAIVPANYDDDLALLADCDLVIEAVAEKADIKTQLYQRVVPALADHALLVSNTSGLSIQQLAQSLPAELQSRFCGVHFFNPPRYMALVELIAGPATAPQVLDALETFLVRTLGKSVVRARDTPNFIGNRIGVFSLLAAMNEAERFGLSYEVVDELTGQPLGRPRSGTFRTADVVGLDTLAHVIHTLSSQLPHDPFAQHFGLPPVIQKLVAENALGQKTGAGFYRKEGKDILRLDPASHQYVKADGQASADVIKILKLSDPAERLRTLRQSNDPQAAFVWAVLRDLFHYSAVHLAEIADTAREVDLAMRGGFGYQVGPFELWQQAGWQQVAQWIQEDIAAGRALSSAPLPPWVLSGPVAERGAVHTPEGSWNPAAGRFEPRAQLPAYRRQRFPERLLGEGGESPADAGHTVFESAAVRAWHLTDDSERDSVLIVSIKSRQHTLGPEVVQDLQEALAQAEANFTGLVIWQPTAPFSVGADLRVLHELMQKDGIAAVEAEQRRMQQLMRRLRHSPVPVVAGMLGMALGGGCELALYADRRVLAPESYLGLVEVGVGLVPGAGGLVFGARRAASLHSAAPDTPLLQFLKRFATNAAMATVSGSALDARDMGWLHEGDLIVGHEREVLLAAIDQALGLANAGYRPPLPERFAVVGRDGRATLAAQLVNMRDGGFISAYDYLLADTLLNVMCGGDVEPGSLVDDEWMFGLERQAFAELLNNPETRERIEGMLRTGKPVRN